MSSPQRPERPQSRGEEARRAVEAVLREQAARRARQEKSVEVVEARRHASGPLGVALVLLVGLSVSIWTLPPAWARPEPFPEPSTEALEAGLRMDMWIAVQRILDFQADRGRLPVALWEAVGDPSDLEDLRYERTTGATFRLVGRREGIEVVYESDDPPEALTEPARTTIGRGT